MKKQKLENKTKNLSKKEMLKIIMSDLGKRGGAVKSDAKSDAARKNGKKGGRPKKKFAKSK